jgi:condensin complex subunit 2
MDLPFLKLQSEHIDLDEPEEYLLADRTLAGAEFGDDGGFTAFDGGFGGDQDEGFGGEFHAATDAEFGKGGDTWADESMVHERAEGQGFGPLTELKSGQNQFVMALSGQEGENILSYFDDRAGKNWAGPEHWRIQRIKKGMFLSVCGGESGSLE